jgi:hypothetical protein
LAITYRISKGLAFIAENCRVNSVIEAVTGHKMQRGGRHTSHRHSQGKTGEGQLKVRLKESRWQEMRYVYKAEFDSQKPVFSTGDGRFEDQRPVVSLGCKFGENRHFVQTVQFR